MFGRDEILRWLYAYDSRKYATTIYEELIIRQRRSTHRMSILGAWKTGCLRRDPEDSAYTDGAGVCYSFTDRWSPKCPVGYDVWTELDAAQSRISAHVPSRYPPSEPQIVRDLRSRPGFGFIWAVFVLHTFRPEVFPLYDQHVHRAYRYLSTRAPETPDAAPRDWTSYGEYRTFFREQVRVAQLSFWLCDRALWAYGRHLRKLMRAEKRGHPRVGRVDQLAQGRAEAPSSLAAGREWVQDRTLGGKAKPFWWRIDARGQVTIRRLFRTRSGDRFIEKTVTRKELDRLDRYVSESGWVPLANNVETLRKGEERDGIGRFLHDQLGWSETASQLASHLAAIYTAAGAWKYNGKKRGMRFRRVGRNWDNAIREYLRSRHQH